MKFEFPTLFETEEKEKQKKDEEKIKQELIDNYKNFEGKSQKRPGLPGWFNFWDSLCV